MDRRLIGTGRTSQRSVPRMVIIAQPCEVEFSTSFDPSEFSLHQGKLSHVLKTLDSTNICLSDLPATSCRNVRWISLLVEILISQSAEAMSRGRRHQLRMVPFVYPRFCLGADDLVGYQEDQNAMSSKEPASCILVVRQCVATWYLRAREKTNMSSSCFCSRVPAYITVPGPESLHSKYAMRRP